MVVTGRMIEEFSDIAWSRVTSKNDPSDLQQCAGFWKVLGLIKWTAIAESEASQAKSQNNMQDGRSVVDVRVQLHLSIAMSIARAEQLPVLRLELLGADKRHWHSKGALLESLGCL
jgi:hypothetical protein